MVGTDKNRVVYFTVCFLLLLAFGIHLQLLDHQFMIDDWQYQNGSYLTDFSSLSDILFKPFKQHYAPLNLLLNVLLANLFANHVFLYYSFNLILFYTGSFLFYKILMMISENRLFSLLCVALFVIHPVNAELISHISLNIILLAMIFQLLSLLLWIKYLRQEKYIYLFASFLFFILALFSQETSLIYPVSLLVTTKLIEKNVRKKHLMLIGVYFFLSILFFSIWVKMASGNAQFLQKLEILDLNFLTYAKSWLFLNLWYLKNLIIPKDFIFIYAIQPHHQQMPYFLFPIFYIFLAVCIFCFIKKNKMILAGLIWFLSGFVLSIPAVLAHAYSGMVMEPYWYTFSSLGFFMIVGKILIDLKKMMSIQIWYVLISCILCFQMYYTHQQIQYSRTEELYAKRWLELSPSFVMPKLVLTRVYMSQKKYPQAYKMVNQIKMNQWSDELSSSILLNKAIIQDELKMDPQEVNTNFQSSLKLNPLSVNGNYAYSIFLAKQKKYIEAIPYMEQAQRRNPFSYTYVSELGRLYLLTNQRNRTISLIEDYLERVPGAPQRSFLKLLLVDLKESR